MPGVFPESVQERAGIPSNKEEKEKKGVPPLFVEEALDESRKLSFPPGVEG